MRKLPDMLTPAGRFRCLRVMAVALLLLLAGTPALFAGDPAALAARPVDLADPDREVLPDVVERVVIESEPWVQRVLDLNAGIVRLEKTAADADALYVELGPVLRDRLDLLQARIGEVDSVLHPVAVPDELAGYVSTLKDLHSNVHRLYQSRMELMERVSADLQAEITGTKLFGAQELRTELQYIAQTFRYQLFGLPAAGEMIKVRIQRAPLRVVSNLFQMGFLFFLFFWWRRWFPETLESMRRSLMAVRPRGPREVSRMKLIWYIEQVRSPLEWLLVIALLAALVRLDPLLFFKETLLIVVLWLLLARTTILLINAVAARGDVGLTGDEAALRLKSLRLVAGWLLVLGIGLSLADYLTGEGAFHALVWRAFKLLSLPVAVVLLVWWRETIFTRLSLEPDETGSLKELLAHPDGLRGLLGAASGLGYLIAAGLRRAALRRVGAGDLLGDVARNRVSDSLAAEQPGGDLNEETVALRAAILEPEEPYARYARAERRALVQRINSGLSGSAVVTGQRGIGKSCFLASLSERVDGPIVHFDCRAARAADFLRDFQARLGITGVRGFDPAEVLGQLRAQGVRAVTIDNAHRLIRPAIGGQRELESAAAGLREVGFGGTWVYSIDRYAWRFAVAGQPSRAFADTLVELPPWTDEELDEYLEQRSGELGCDPDFSEIRLPRQYLDARRATPSERNRAGLIRLLNDYAGGNLSVVLRLWAESLTVEPDGRVVCALPSLAASSELDQLPLDVLLVLRVIAQFEALGRDDIRGALRLTQGEGDTAVRTCLIRGWIVESDGLLALDWKWFPVITRILARQNLLAR